MNTTVRRGERKPSSLTVAMAEAERGNAVVSMKPGTKQPIEKWAHGEGGPLGHRDPETLKAEWPKSRAAVGILTGPSGLVVIDLDVPNGEDDLRGLAAKRRSRVIPPTRTLATPSGGKHLIFTTPEGLEFKTCARQLANANGETADIDIRGRGGLIKVWDPDEPGRRWIDDRDPVEIPGWLAALLPLANSPASRALNGEAVKFDIESLLRDGVKPGGQEDVLYRLAWRLRLDRISKTTARIIWDTILANSVTRMNAKGEKRPPWTSADFDDKWDSADREISIAEEELKDARNWRPIPSGRSGLLAAMRTGDWLDRQEFPPLVYSVPDLIPEGVSLLVGPPKAGKSTLLRRITLECARGGKVFGIKCKRRDVFYLALEDDDARMQEGCRELLGDGVPIPARFSYMTEIEPGKLIPTVGAWLDVHPGGIVAIDTLGRALERPEKGEDTYARDYRILSLLKDIAKKSPGCTIVVSHHTRKAKSDDFVDMVSGTNAIAGGADTIIVLLRKRGASEGLWKVTSRRMSDAEYSLVLERPSGWRLDGEDLLESSAKATALTEQGRLGERSTAVITCVTNHPEGVTIAEVAEATGLSPKDATTYLHLNYQAGYIARPKRGVYSPIASERKIRLGRKEDESPSGQRDQDYS